MPSQTKLFGPNKRPVGSKKNKSKILKMSRNQTLITCTFMRQPNKPCPSSAISVNNSMSKGASKSSHVPTSKGMKQPTASRFGNHRNSVEKQKPLSSSKVEGKVTHALTRRGEVMSALTLKTTKRLGQYSDLSSRSKKRARSEKEEDNTSAKYSTAKLELAKGTSMIHKDNSTTEGNESQDEIAIDKENTIEFGEYCKEGGTRKAKHTLDSILSIIDCNFGSISSYSSNRDLAKFQGGKTIFLDDNHSRNLTFKIFEEIGLIERNIGQFSNCNGKTSNSMTKKRKEPLSAENPKALDNDSNVGVQVEHMKKFRHSIVTRKDQVEDGGGNLNHVVVQDDIVSVSKSDHAKVSMSSCVEQQCYSCSKPIDKPAWSGLFKTNGKEYASLDGHLSTKSCEKAWSLSKQLHQMVEVKRLSRLEVWPKAWDISKPTGDDIGIYFFPHEMRQDKGLDQLLREVMQNDLALRAIIGEAEMLIFPSILLSNHHQTFQGKHYLWGVFKRREDKGVVVEEPLNDVGRCEIEKQQNVVSDQPNHKLPGVEPNQEMIEMVSIIPLERQMLSPNENTQEVEASRLRGPINKGFDLKAPSEKGGKAEGTPIATNVVAFSASHGQVNPSMGHTPGNLMGFVVRKTPKLDRIIREMEQEGALVFAMQGEMVGAGSWMGSKATPTQK